MWRGRASHVAFGVPTRRSRRSRVAAFVALAAASSSSYGRFGGWQWRSFVWSPPSIVCGHSFKPGSAPPGLRYCTDFISAFEEGELLRTLEQGQWQHDVRRGQQFFGLVYYHTCHDVIALQPGDTDAQSGRPMTDLPAWILPRILETGVFSGPEEINQVAANEYLGTNGIAAHVEDATCFGPNLATLSLLAPVELTLTPAEQPLDRTGRDHGNWVKILLEPRSLLVLQGESRYAYRHGIRKSKLVTLRGKETLRRTADYRRVSLTFRELLDTRRKLYDAREDLTGQKLHSNDCRHARL